MQFPNFLTLMTFLVFAIVLTTYAVAIPQKSIIVSYPDSTPESALDEAKAAVRAAGGIITHEYKLIRGFAARVSAQGMKTVQALGNAVGASVEEDMIVSINNGTT